MRRFRKSFLLKVAVALVFFIFATPLLMNFLEDYDHTSAKKIKQGRSHFRKKEQFDNQSIEQVEQPLQAPNQLVNSMDQDVIDRPLTVFKTGVLGNYEPTETRKETGTGDWGKPVHTSLAEKAAADRTIQEFGFNMVISDKISLDRIVPDTRVDECKYWHYPETLPTASVILVFHNEGWSTLLRTVHSVINQSPPKLLKEVVMVDDFSDKEHLKGRLDEYVAKFNGLVKLYRNKKREGLIRTRTLGGQYAVGDVIIFLDAHCECNYNWLPPLLARIAYDRKIMAVPVVEGIDLNNFRYHPVYTTDHHRGIFEWGFLYKESRVPPEELKKRKHDSEPYWSPTHAGGLFAMDRKYFQELGGYDPGMQIWGGENFELSFKIWMCGGSIEWVPCSRVGHIYRNHMPYGFGAASYKVPIVLLNYMRVVEVWLEDFKEYFYTREPTIKGYPVGDISGQLEFKRKNNCKSFKWFMDNIAYEVYDQFPLPPPNKAWGEVKQHGSNLCWDTLGTGPGGGPIGVGHCHHFGGSQLFRLNTEGQIGVGERCIHSKTGHTLHMAYCDIQPTGPWQWDKEDGQIRNTDYNKCVGVDASQKLSLIVCDRAAQYLKWEIDNVNPWK